MGEQHRSDPFTHAEPTDLGGKAFVWAERLLLLVAAVMTFAAAWAEVVTVFERGTVELADILLMFLYTEVIGMIAVFYSGKGAFFIYPINPG